MNSKLTTNTYKVTKRKITLYSYQLYVRNTYTTEYTITRLEDGMTFTKLAGDYQLWKKRAKEAGYKVILCK